MMGRGGGQPQRSLSKNSDRNRPQSAAAALMRTKQVVSGYDPQGFHAARRMQVDYLAQKGFNPMNARSIRLRCRILP